MSKLTKKEVLAELRVAKLALNKFAKFDPNKSYKICIRHAQKVLNVYCRIKFEGCTYDHHPCAYISETACGKKVSLFSNGSQFYSGTISYLERWWVAYKKFTYLSNRVAKFK